MTRHVQDNAKIMWKWRWGAGEGVWWNELLLIHPWIHSIATCQNNLKWYHLKMCFSARMSDHQLRPTDATQVETLICATSKALPLGKSGGNSKKTLAARLLNFGGFIGDYGAWICEWMVISQTFFSCTLVLHSCCWAVVIHSEHGDKYRRLNKRHKDSAALQRARCCHSIWFRGVISEWSQPLVMRQTHVCVCLYVRDSVCVYVRFIY